MEFVTLEIAKKLKEKGFREECLCYYIGEDLFYNIESPIANNQLWFSHNKYDNIWHRDNYDAPTISQVLGWLREKHLLVIPVPAYFNAEGVCVSWDCDIWADDNYEHCHRDKKTYEEAALAGIEYVLDKLI